MREQKIIKACLLSRTAYSKVAAHIGKDQFTPFGEFWYKQIAEWYARPDAEAVDLEILRERALRGQQENHRQPLSEWLDTLPDVPSPENVADEVIALKREGAWRELALQVETGQDSDKLLEAAQKHLELLQATSLAKSSVRVSKSLWEALEETQKANRIPLFPRRLNERCDGGIVRGQHIVAFGRPECGKTAFSINMTAGWLFSGLKVLYVGNEDPVSLLRERITASLANMTVEQVRQHPQAAHERSEARGASNLTLVHLYPGSVWEIEELLKEGGPYDCLVIDQLRNLHTAEGGRGTRAQGLDRIARDVRQLLSKHNLVGLSVGQAHASEHNSPKLWLDTDDFDESRTGVPGQADLMVGIGYTQDMKDTPQRGLSLCKNKLSGNHDCFMVNLDKHRNRIQ